MDESILGSALKTDGAKTSCAVEELQLNAHADLPLIVPKHEDGEADESHG